MLVVLLQKIDEGEDVPISFMTVSLKNHELRYSLTKKHAFLVVIVVKKKSSTISYTLIW